MRDIMGRGLVTLFLDRDGEFGFALHLRNGAGRRRAAEAEAGRDVCTRWFRFDEECFGCAACDCRAAGATAGSVTRRERVWQGVFLGKGARQICIFISVSRLLESGGYPGRGGVRQNSSGKDTLALLVLNCAPHASLSCQAFRRSSGVCGCSAMAALIGAGFAQWWQPN